MFNIPIEVALMKRAAGGPESAGMFASLTLLDWYYIEHDVILVIERPAPCLGLKEYLDFRGGTFQEQEAKVLKLCVCRIVKQLLTSHKNNL